MKEPLVYIQRDLEEIKHALHQHLRPYKSDVKSLREMNASFRATVHRKDEEIERLLMLIAKKAPDLLDDALAALVDPQRRGWKVFRRNWLARLGVSR